MTSGRLSMLAAGALCAIALVAAPARADKLDTSLRQLSAAGAPGVIVLARDGARTRRLARGDAILATHAPMRPTPIASASAASQRRSSPRLSCNWSARVG